MALPSSIRPFTRCLVRPQSIHPQCLRFSPASPRWLQLEPQTTPELSSQPQPNSFPDPVEVAFTSTPKPKPKPSKQLPYHVSRTPTNNLPIYTDIKAGNTLRQTRIRKIAGDAQALRMELIKGLKLDPEREKCEINGVTGHIIIKGWHKPRVEKFLIEKGF